MQRKHVLLSVCWSRVSTWRGSAYLFRHRPISQIFPVPSVSTSKNDGNDTGLIMPILITDPDGELKYLMAPCSSRIPSWARRGVFNLFRYEPGGRQMRFIASLTERIERKLFLAIPTRPSATAAIR